MPKIVQKIDPDFQISSEQQSPLTESYNFIPYETRIRLIKMVIQEKWKTRAATIHLGLKISTGKNIMKAFRESGRIHVRKQEKGKIIPHNLLMDLEMANQVMKLEKEKLEKKARKLQKREQIEKKVQKGNQNEIKVENIAKTMTKDVLKTEYCQNQIIKKQRGQNKVQEEKISLKTEYCQYPIKQYRKQYFQTVFHMNMNHQNMNIDPSIKIDNMMMIKSEFSDYQDFLDFYLPLHPYFF